MERCAEGRERQVLFVGIDVHKRSYHVTGVLSDGRQVFSAGMSSDKDGLLRCLLRTGYERIEAVYEAGYFGYGLHDYLEEHGIGCMVTPPSLIPGEYGNRVKTDRRDSKKLALYLAKGLLKRVYVPSEEERCHRQVIRTRRQLTADRIRKQSQIKAFLAQHDLPLPEARCAWTKQYVGQLHKIMFKDRWLRMSFKQLLTAYDQSDTHVREQTDLLKALSKTNLYRERVAILTSIPGIGTISAMELLLELQDVERFRTAGQLAAYVGLTPSQFSSGENVRMGRITRIGKSHLRATLIEAAWILIRKDAEMAKTYAQIQYRAGGKRAIVAIARRLLVRARSMLRSKSSYAWCA